VSSASRSASAERLNPVLARSLRECALWLCAALALVLFIALSSYDPADPGWSSTGEPGRVGNRVGPVGAWLADACLLLFGGPAFLLPVLVAMAGWQLFRKSEPSSGRWHFWLRTCGFAVTLAASSGLATLHFASHYPESAGGILGEVIGTGLAHGLRYLGATLLLLGLWFAGVSLFLSLSWLTVIDAIGRGVLGGISATRAFWMARQDARAGRENRATRQQSIREEKKKSEFRPAPRIEVAAPEVEKSERVEQEKQVPLFERPAASVLPPLNLLDDAGPREPSYSPEALEAMSRLVELKLRDFGVEVEVVEVHPGPVVTRFELRPSPGTKVSQISGLAKDLARALSAISVRVVEVIPGKSVVGLEIPNEKREIVTLGEILRSKAYDEMASPLAIALGKDIAGHPVVADLQRMPHLLIAGTTGSGKSVAINAMVLSLLYKATAEHVRLIMIDPKMLELSVYEGIPHLLAPVVTDMKQAANALRWCVAEMERRYQLMAPLGVRNIGGYNRKIKDAADGGKPVPDPLLSARLQSGDTSVLDAAGNVPACVALPYVVVIIDELADLMMIVGKKVEELIARLAQKARASGIHLILATQRPSVDVITGLIKANIPTRIAFQVSAKVDSRTILDQSGAESLLGHGDMLYLPPGVSVPNRVHGAFVSDQEVHRVVSALRGAPPTYLEEILDGPRGPLAGIASEEGEAEGSSGEQDALYDEAVRIVAETRKASVSGIQRRLKIGYNRAARLVETMEAAGLVGPLQPNGSREVLTPPPAEG
jgi:DNA segregation ATPase FtsK/SpoIIIE, S-DNA-T family